MLKKEYENIKSPQELLNLMSKINYGYLGKNGRIYHFDDEDFNSSWEKNYILESPEEILKTGFGNCWDQTELERCWFENKGYEYKTLYEMVKLDYDTPYPTHSFLIYKDENNNWNWFENSDYDNRGIHTFSTLEELIKYQLNNYKKLLKKYNITSIELEKIILNEFSKPKVHSTSEEYLEHVINSPSMDFQK